MERGPGGGVGFGLMEPPPPLFRFCLQWKAFDLLYKMKYILCVVALLEVSDVTKRGRHLAFLQELQNQVKTVPINNVLRLTRKTTHK